MAARASMGMPPSALPALGNVPAGHRAEAAAPASQTREAEQRPRLDRKLGDEKDEDDDNDNDGDDGDDGDGKAGGAAVDDDQAAATQQQKPEPPPPPFEPLFTLVTNVTTNTTIHPRVQYLFSDDDDSGSPSPLLSGPPTPHHRAIVVDLAPSADRSQWTVAWAASLTPDFAVTVARLASPHDQNSPRNQRNVHDAVDEAASVSPSAANASAAPDVAAADASAGALLRVEGVEREPVADARPVESLRGSSSGSGFGSGSGCGVAIGSCHDGDDVDALANDFRRRMSFLRSVVAEADKRGHIVHPQHESTLPQQHRHQGAPVPTPPPRTVAKPMPDRHSARRYEPRHELLSATTTTTRRPAGYRAQIHHLFPLIPGHGECLTIRVLLTALLPSY